MARGEVFDGLLSITAEFAVVISKAIHGQIGGIVVAEEVVEAPLFIADVGPEGDHRQVFGHKVLFLEWIRP